MTHSTVDIVTDFYRAITNLDSEALTASVQAHFDEDAAIEWPGSLPHGGRIEGSRRLKSVFSAIAKPDAAAGLTGLQLIRVIGEGDAVVAWIEFDWKHPNGSTSPNAALELWQFTAEKVTEIRVFYWNSDIISGKGEK